MQQLSGSSGRGGTNTPAITWLAFSISERRSRGEERREEKIMEGLVSSASFVVVVAETGGGVLAEGVMGLGESAREDSRRIE